MPNYPRVFVVRHGETEWSLNGRHTGATDLPLTENGEKRVRQSAEALVGEDRLLTTSTIKRIFVSPLQRARKTLELLHLPKNIPVEETEDIIEWNYGEYEGVTSKDIQAQREREGKGRWNLWKEGCPGGESPEDVTKRLDAFIARIREIQGEAVENNEHGDVVVVAHGHILRAFTARWIDDPIMSGNKFLLSAGGVGVLAYEHQSFDEPCVDCWNITDGKGVGPTISRPKIPHIG